MKTKLGLLVAALPLIEVQYSFAAEQGEAGVLISFWFDRVPWLIFAAAFCGIYMGSKWQRINSSIDGRRVRRHDRSEMFSHWCHVFGSLILLVTGFSLGIFSLPRLLPGPGGAAMLMNLHFIGALFFVFGGFFWATNIVVSPLGVLMEHLPERNSIKEGIIYYAHIFKLTKKEVQPGKFHGSERVAFVFIVLLTMAMTFSGFIKLSARMIPVSDSILQSATWIHDITTLLILPLIIVHATLGAFVPWSWPLLGSMLSGYVPLDYAEKNHKTWIKEMKAVKQNKEQS